MRTSPRGEPADTDPAPAGQHGPRMAHCGRAGLCTLPMDCRFEQVARSDTRELLPCARGGRLRHGRLLGRAPGVEKRHVARYRLLDHGAGCDGRPRRRGLCRHGQPAAFVVADAAESPPQRRLLAHSATVRRGARLQWSRHAHGGPIVLPAGGWLGVHPAVAAGPQGFAPRHDTACSFRLFHLVESAPANRARQLQGSPGRAGPSESFRASRGSATPGPPGAPRGLARTRRRRGPV